MSHIDIPIDAMSDVDIEFIQGYMHGIEWLAKYATPQALEEHLKFSHEYNCFNDDGSFEDDGVVSHYSVGFATALKIHCPKEVHASQPTDAALSENERLRARPENTQFDIQTVAGFVAYYRLNPPQEEFDGSGDVGMPGDFPVSVGVCGMYGRVLNEFEYEGIQLQLEDQPDHQSDAVVLGIHGAAGRRLTNVLLGQDEAIQLAGNLLDAAGNVSPPDWDDQKQTAIGKLVNGFRDGMRRISVIR